MPERPRGVRAEIAASAGTIFLATGVSRILGFVRDLLIARLFGTGQQAQAFVVAFRLPNLFRDLVAEGAVTSAIVPVLSATRSTKSSDEFWHLAQAVGVRMVVAVTVLGGVGIVGAPWLVRAIAPGFTSDPDKFTLTVQLTRVLFPLVTLVGLWAFWMGLLNSLRHFLVPALGPAILNLAMIAGCLWLAPRMSLGIWGLAWGVMLGGFVQWLIQLPVAASLGFRWRWTWRHPGSQEVMRLLGPRLAGVAVHQASVFLNTILASLATLAGEGAVAALYFANRLVQLPLALFGVASAQGSLPALAAQAARREFDTFRSTLVSLLRMVAFVTIPAAVGLVVLARPIVEVCLQRGAFDEQSTIMTAQALAWFAVGLLAYSASKVLTSAFYALHDTRTPVRLAAEALGINIVLAFACLKPLGVGGLALATALSSSFNAWRLLRLLERRLGTSLGLALSHPLLRMCACALIMGVGCRLAWSQAMGARIAPLVGLPLVIVGGIILYGIGCRLIHVEEQASVWRWFIRLVGLNPSSDA